jgi:hypothetical protein
VGRVEATLAEAEPGRARKLQEVRPESSCESEARLKVAVNHYPIGRTRWAIPEGYIPRESTGPAPELTSHESVCILNATDEEALVRITIYFSDREPAGPYELTVPARRTRHVRLGDLGHPERIPRGTDYASVIEASVPVVVQHTRLDSRQAENALMTTMAYGEDG